MSSSEVFWTHSNQPEYESRTIGLLTSIGLTLDSFFVEIVDHWKAAGLRVATASGDQCTSFSNHTVIKGLTRNPSVRNVTALTELRKWVRAEGIDVVVTSTATASTLARLAPLNVPIIYFCHGLHWNGPGSLKDRMFQGIEALLLRRTTGVICLNSMDEEWFNKVGQGTPRLRLDRGVGLDIERFRRVVREPWRPSAALRLVWCGELSDRKNPMALIDVAKVLHARGIELDVQVLGDGPMQTAVSAEAQHCPGVRLVGRTDPVPYFARAHALVVTSRWEGLPRVALEATAMGIPTVGFDVKGVNDIPGSYLAPEGDVEDLAEKILNAAASGPEDLVDPEELSYRRAAEEIQLFLEETLKWHA